jgi:hypothetical protein
MNSNTAQLSMKDRSEAEGDDACARLGERFARHIRTDGSLSRTRDLR